MREMKRIEWLVAVLVGGVFALSASALAQGPQQSRYGAVYGLPRDFDKLALPDEAYPRFPLPPGNEAYAHVDGRKMKGVMEEVTAISRKSRDDGNQYWGRIPGTPYDRMMQD